MSDSSRPASISCRPVPRPCGISPAAITRLFRLEADTGPLPVGTPAPAWAVPMAPPCWRLSNQRGQDLMSAKHSATLGNLGQRYLEEKLPIAVIGPERHAPAREPFDVTVFKREIPSFRCPSIDAMHRG